MTATIDPRIIKARSTLLLSQPFWGVLALKLEITPTKTLTDTIGTDMRKLYYNPAYLDELQAKYPGDYMARIQGVVAHEIGHCILRHNLRRGERTHKQWNIACDYPTNEMVANAGFTLPDDGLLDARFFGLSAEEVYRAREIEQQEKKEQQQKQDEGQGDNTNEGPGESSSGEPGEDEGDEDGDQGGGEGQSGDDDQAPQKPADGSGEPGDDDISESGEGDQSKPGEAGDGDDGEPRCGEVMDAEGTEEEKAAEDVKWSVSIRQAITAATKANGGKVPAGLEDIVGVINAKPVMNWREVLREFINSKARVDYSWQKPDRRLFAQGITAPGQVPDGAQHVAVLIDTSGSIGMDLLDKFKAEVQGMLDEGFIEKLTIVYCTTHVYATQEVFAGEQWTLIQTRSGGTAFSPAFDWVNENTGDVVAAIYFTDMECSDHGAEPAYPVLWAAYGDPRSIHAYPPPFGEVIEVT